MRFLVVFVAVLGYASASIYGPLAYGINAGNLQAAAIDATVAAQNNARLIGEGQAGAAEIAIQHNIEATRQVAERSRDINENVYWGSVAANQNGIAAAQSYAAAANGAVAGRTAYNGWGAAPYGVAALGYNGLGYNGLGYNGLGYNGLGYNGLGLRAW